MLLYYSSNDDLDSKILKLHEHKDCVKYKLCMNIITLLRYATFVLIISLQYCNDIK